MELERPQAPAPPKILDLPSESLIAWEHEGFPQTDYAAFSLRGECDPAALEQALISAQADHPTFHALLKPTRQRVLTLYAWHWQERPCGLELRDFTGLEFEPADLDAWVHEQMAPDIAHLQDLQREYPVRFILFTLPAGLHVFVLLFHHVATDGGGVYDFLRQAFRIYHRSVTSVEPDWAETPGLHAQVGQIKPVQPPSAWRFWREALKEAWRFPPQRVARLVSTPTGLSGRRMLKHVIDDPALQAALRERARRSGGTLSDLFVSASKLALQEFNAERNAPHDVMLHGLAVNQRLRRAAHEIADQGNPMAGILIPSNLELRRDPEALLRYVIEQRRYKLDNGFDIAGAQRLHNAIRIGRLLPFSIRYHWLRKLLDMRISFFVTNLGVVWPRLENGRPTGETAVRQIGRMELRDIHSSVGSTENNPMALILRTFLGRFYMVFIHGRHGLPDADADRFAKLVIDKAMGYL